MSYGDILRDFFQKQRVKEKYADSKMEIRLVRHCAAISAIAELLFYFDVIW